MPLKGTDCGLPPALSAMVTAALRAPDAVGVNVTLMVQLLPALTDVPHVVVWPKSPAFVPVIVMLTPASVAVPVLVSVMA